MDAPSLLVREDMYAQQVIKILGEPLKRIAVKDRSPVSEVWVYDIAHEPTAELVAAEMGEAP